MNNFSQDQQVKIVKEALDLSVIIKTEEDELQKLKAEKFDSIPKAPVKKELPPPQIVQPQYPPVPKANYSFGDHVKAYFKENMAKSILLLLFLSLVWLILVFISYSDKLKEMNDKLAQEPEYIKARANAEKAAAEKQDEINKKHKEEQEKIDIEYEKNKSYYDTVTIPDYNNRLEKWENNQKIKIQIIENEINLNSETLSELYGETKIISAKYREIWMLDWLYEDMSTSDHDIRESITLLNSERQIDATERAASRTSKAIENMHRDMNQGFGAIYAAVDEGNELQAETVSRLSKIRRDINIGNAVGTYQRDITNSYLDELINGKKKK